VTHRDAFLQAVESLLGSLTLWAQKGPDSFDCSGLVTACVLKVGGPDLRHTHSAQALHDATRALEPGRDIMLPGDLVFYGHGPDSIEHVAVYDEFGGVVSADGATSHILSPAVAMANPANRVRRHNTVRYRSDLPFVAVHRNTYVDALDAVSR
jgi:cell wall-associated NlpC family hydrolase